MGTYAVTGGTTGIGGAITKMLREKGETVINIDIKDGDIVCDLSKKEGRDKAIEEVHKKAPDGLDGFIPCAGLGPTVPNLGLIVAVNYFATRILIEELKDLVAKKKGKVVIIASNSAALPGGDEEFMKAMLEDNDEKKALELIAKLDGHNAYCGSKQAITRWMRRIAPAWVGEGVQVNAVAPGATMTPLLQEGLDDPNYGPLIRDFKVPMGDFGTPEQIAKSVMFLLSEDASFFCGSVMFVDGGTDAMLRPDDF